MLIITIFIFLIFVRKQICKQIDGNKLIFMEIDYNICILYAV